MIVILIFGGMPAVFAESSQKENIVSKGLDANINYDDITYTGMDKIKNDDGYIYTYTVDDQVFTSEISDASEDDAFLKGIYTQYEQGL